MIYIVLPFCLMFAFPIVGGQIVSFLLTALVPKVFSASIAGKVLLWMAKKGVVLVADEVVREELAKVTPEEERQAYRFAMRSRHMRPLVC